MARKEPKYMERAEEWDFDEPEAKGGIVTLHYGWSFEHGCHEGVRGFDTKKEAREAVKTAWPCKCKECVPKKGPGGCKPKLPADKKRRKDTITLLPVTWDKLDKIGPSRGKAIDKLVEFYESN